MKRSNGEGSIYWSGTLQTWVGELVLPDGNKKRKKNKRQSVVKTWLEDQKDSIKKGNWVAANNLAFGEFFDRYMNEVAKYTLRQTTFQSYNYCLGKNVLPKIGNIKLAALRGDHLQHLYSELIDGGLSKNTIKYIHTVIRKSLATARKWKLVSLNVAEDVEIPVPDTFEIQPLTVDEVKRFLKVLEGDRLYAFYMLICTTAIREGEALGLQKRNLLLDDGVVLIRHSLAYIRHEGLTLGEPKSKSSKRDIALPALTVEVLRRHLAEHPNTSGYVFATGNNTPFSPRNIIRHFKSKLIQAGLPYKTRIHDLRHSVISWLLASGGISLKDAQGLAGHAQASTTADIYGHLMPDYSRNAAKKIEGLFGTE